MAHPRAETSHTSAARPRIPASKGADQTAPTTAATNGLRTVRKNFETARLPRARANFRCLKSLRRVEDAAKVDLTAATLAALESAWQGYNTAVGAPVSGARARRKAFIGQLPDDFRAAEEEFAAFDDLILQFDDDDGPGTHFIDTWFSARRVEDTGRRAARPAPQPTPPAPVLGPAAPKP